MTSGGDGKEFPLSGGNASGDVVRVGDTVRKPWMPSTANVFALMQAVRATGVDVPAALGRDADGRQVTEFVPGTLALEAPELSPTELAHVGRLVRSIHEASLTFTPSEDATWDPVIPAPGTDFICHNDLAPWNLIVGERWVFIDWDGAGPSTRVWDLAYAAQSFTLNDPTRDPRAAAERLRSFVDGYGAELGLREQLPAAMVRRAQAMVDLLESSYRVGDEPWSSMFLEGHGAHWRGVVAYLAHHELLWAEALDQASG